MSTAAVPEVDRFCLDPLQRALLLLRHDRVTVDALEEFVQEYCDIREAAARRQAIHDAAHVLDCEGDRQRALGRLAEGSGNSRAKVRKYMRQAARIVRSVR